MINSSNYHLFLYKMSSNEPGKLKKIKEALKKMDNYLVEKGVTKYLSEVPGKLGNHLRGLNKFAQKWSRKANSGMNWLADKIDNTQDGTQLPSFVKGIASIGSGLLRTIGGIFNLNANVLKWIGGLVKGHETGIVVLTPDTINGNYDNVKDSTFTMCYPDNTSFIHWKTTPSIQGKGVKVLWRKDIIKEEQKDLMVCVFNKRIEKFIVSVQGLNIENIESKYEEKYGGSVLSISFYNNPQKNVSFLILKNKISVTREKHETGKYDRFKVELKKMNKEERGITRID